MTASALTLIEINPVNTGASVLTGVRGALIYVGFTPITSVACCAFTCVGINPINTASTMFTWHGFTLIYVGFTPLTSVKPVVHSHV